MKHIWLKCAAVVAAVLMGTIGAQAAWTYDSDALTLSDGDYTFNVKIVSVADPSANGASVDGLQITGTKVVGTGTTIDFTSAKTDTGHDVISLSAIQFLNKAPCTTFLAPALMDFGQQAFRGNKAIENVTVSDKITTFGFYCLENASKLKTFSPTRLPYITNMNGANAENAFYGCSSLPGDFDLPNVTNISAKVFYGTAITSVKMPKIQKIGDHVFRDCKKLLGDFKFDDLESIGHCAFMDCKLITSFEASKAILASYAFSGCVSLTNIVVSKEMTVIGDNTFANCPITSFDAPKVTEIGAQAFQSCSVLTNLNAPLVTTLRNSALYLCKKLAKIDMPKLESIGNSGVRDTALKELIAPGVTYVGAYAFMGCGSITNIQLDAACATNYGDRVYENCGKLVKLDPWPSLLNVTNVGTGLINPISGCRSLVGSIELTGPAGLHTIPNGWMNYCNNITSITIRTPWITNVVAWSVMDLAPGAVIYWNTQKAPISFGQAFYSKDSNNRARIVVRGDLGGWSNTVYSAALAELTDTDKGRADWPGKKTFGLITNSPNGRASYLVDGRGGLCIRIQ